MEGNLPSEIIECILSRLPVKSLIRFKSVSKSWAATISTAEFAAVHLQHVKTNYNNGGNNQFLIPVASRLMRDQDASQWCKTYRMIGFEGWKLPRASLTLQFPLSELHYLDKVTPLCHCDGLIIALVSSRVSKKYVLWNPLARASMAFACPYKIEGQLKYGLGYDPMTKDYKFVIWSLKMLVLAVFYCRDSCWSVLKKVDAFEKDKLMSFPVGPFQAIYSGGHLYWSITNIGDAYQPIESRIEILRFDCSKETMKRVVDRPRLRGWCSRTKVGLFACTGHGLGLFYDVPTRLQEIFVLKSNNGGEHSWKKVKDDNIGKMMSVMGHHHSVPVFLANEGEAIVFQVWPEFCKRFLIYNKRESSLEEIRNNDLHLEAVNFTEFIPVYENLFFTSVENGGRGFQAS